MSLQETKVSTIPYQQVHTYLGTNATELTLGMLSIGRFSHLSI